MEKQKKITLEEARFLDWMKLLTEVNEAVGDLDKLIQYKKRVLQYKYDLPKPRVEDINF